MIKTVIVTTNGSTHTAWSRPIERENRCVLVSTSGRTTFWYDCLETGLYNGVATTLLFKLAPMVGRPLYGPVVIAGAINGDGYPHSVDAEALAAIRGLS